ncbi:intersectin-1-like [Nilaparvata lugens]|uniref:intersectin-1-like n=1 Tax=Nilaparvata lugens TaxID=108931 RepID=UPI00193DA081|nr:intersectin-1-like [Nilaparvata lugens]
MDPWVITPQERARFEVQFNALKPINGIVTGGQARDFFLQSQLPAPVLGIIWGLADTDADGKMNINEFSIACKLINLKLRGFDMPQALPPNMLQFFQPAAVAPGVPASNAALLSGMVPPPKPPLPAAPSPIPAATSKIISPPSGGGTPNLLSPTGILSPPLVAPSPAPLVTAPLVSAPLIGGGVPPPIPPAPVVPLAGLASVTPPSTMAFRL